MHGPTFAGNPLACAAANASLDFSKREPRLAGRRDRGAAARRARGVPRLPGVRDVRVKGAIGVVQLARAPQPTRCASGFVEHGVWVRPFGDVVYLDAAARDRTPDLERLIGCDPRRAARGRGGRRAVGRLPQRCWFGSAAR